MLILYFYLSNIIIKVNNTLWQSFGTAQNFTFSYGSDESGYYYLTVGWEPDDTIQELTNIILRELSKIEEAQIKEKQKESKNKPKSKAVKAAAKVVKEYYSGPVFKVISMEMSSRTKNEIIFSVCVSKDGIIQDPDRSITLKLKNGTWKVTGEGY